jgi:hypothetical protein
MDANDAATSSNLPDFDIRHVYGCLELNLYVLGIARVRKHSVTIPSVFASNFVKVVG